MFSKIWRKLRFFENLHENRDFSKISNKIQKIQDNGYVSKTSKEVGDFREKLPFFQNSNKFSFYSGVDQRKHQSSASLAFVRGIHGWPVNFPHKWPVTWKMFPFDDVIMCTQKRTVMRTLKETTKKLTRISQRLPGGLLLENGPMPRLLMSWLLESSGHQQPRYWLCGKCHLGEIFPELPVRSMAIISSSWRNVYSIIHMGKQLTAHSVNISISYTDVAAFHKVWRPLLRLTLLS